MKYPALLVSVMVLALASAPNFGAAPQPLPTTMNAAGFDKPGGPEVLTLQRVAVPVPKADEVLIRVYAAAVSVWGSGYAPAPERALARPSCWAGRAQEPSSRSVPTCTTSRSAKRVYGVTGIGFYAEYVKARADRIAPVPRSLDLTQASILAISGLSALQGLEDVLELRAGQSLIIHGAAGGVGTLAIQMAKHRGVRVLATASTDEVARQLGADAVVNGRTGDILAAAKAFAPQGVDDVLGLAGGMAWNAVSMRCVQDLVGSPICMGSNPFRDRAGRYA